MTAVPRVSVMSSVRMPIRPRVGTWNSRRTRPEPWFTIFDHLALAHGHLLEHHAHVGLGQVEDEQLQRLLAHAVLDAGDDLGVGDRTARSPRGAWSRSGSRAAARRGP